jgi:hypothetical protein
MEYLCKVAFVVFGPLRPKAALIFGKKPFPRGDGDREGERGKEAAAG